MTNETNIVDPRGVSIEILAERSIRRRCLRLFFRVNPSENPGDPTDRVSYVKSAVVETIDDGAAMAIPDTPFTMTYDSAEALMDELWRLGFRPSEDRQSDTTVNAMDNHISDLRDIVFKALQVEGSKRNRVIR